MEVQSDRWWSKLKSNRMVRDVHTYREGGRKLGEVRVVSRASGCGKGYKS